jgi:DNA (cytosine-5)-methyltransferase 1
MTHNGGAMTAYYNENEPYAARWLRNLMAAGHIAPGVVDERSIEDVQPWELWGFTQCHFFAGIGGWSYALRLAGWPDDREVWTGSCPCQPFSAAGKGAGFADERHLWPAWHHLIRECKPAVVFGEQVASAGGLAWLDGVCADMEAEAYAIAAADLCAAGVGAPHIRQRLWFVGHAATERSQTGARVSRMDDGALESERPRDAGFVADDDSAGQSKQRQHQLREDGDAQPGIDANGCGSDGVVGNADYPGLEGRQRVQERAGELVVGSSGLAGFWADADWLPCRDGKARPVRPGSFPLAYGAPRRVGRLRAYGNAIVPQVAAAFINACLEC